MIIKHFPEELRFEAFREDDGYPIGELRYLIGLDNETLVATHTLVPPRFGSLPVAGNLTQAFIAYAREQKMYVFPVCNYIFRLFEREPEAYKDIASKKRLYQLKH